MFYFREFVLVGSLDFSDSAVSSPKGDVRTPKKKIAGMDPFDFCDLLKSASL